MAFRGDIERWDPMQDDFKDKRFNNYGRAAALQEASSDGVVQLFVAGIPSCLTEIGLRNLMSSVAEILHVSLIAHKNIGFVSVRSKDALNIIAYFNNYWLNNNCLTVKLSKPKKQTVDQPSGAVSGTGIRIASACGKVEQKEKTGHSSNTKFLNELKIPALNYPSAAKYAQVGQELAVKVVNIISPSQFWICHHPYDADSRLKELHDKMQQHYSSLLPKTGFKLNGSGLYAACSRDSGNWCRVQALSCDTESVLVLLLDYGTCERVGLTNLHSLEGQFCSLPFQAMCCSLAHIQGTPQWSEEAADCMRQLLSNKPVCAKVCSISEYLLSVELILSSSSQTVNDVLVLRNYASYEKGFEPSSVQANTQSMAVLTSDLAEPSDDIVSDYPTMKDLSRVRLTVGEQYDVVVLHARNAGDVTVCLNSDVIKLGTLLTELNTYQFSDSYVPHVGEIVAAQYAVDSSCYRAEILSIDNDNTAAVLFLDFGNTATVNLKSVVPLQPRHIAFPVYGISIKFRSSSVDGKLLEEYCKLNLRVVEQHGSQYVISLTDDDTVMQLAKSQSNQCTYSISDVKQCCLDTGKTYKAWVTDATDVENFYVQVQEFDYLVINEQLQTIYSSKSGGYEPQQTGELIAIHLNEDDTWCRAVVKEIENKDVKCHLIDFGMCVTTASKDISRFDSRLLTHPVVAFRCSFYDVVGSRVDSWKDDYLKPMTDVYNMTVVEVKDDLHFIELVHVESGVVWKQKLIDDGFLVKARSSDLHSVMSSAAVDKLPSGNTDSKPGYSSHDSTTLSVSDNRQSEAESSCHVVKAEQVLPSVCDAVVRRLFHNRERIVVVHANSPSDFYVQSGSDCAQKELGSLQRSINKFCRSSHCKLDTNSIRQIVGVLHDDGIWYRGEVVNSESSGKFRVHFVDIGVTKTVASTNLRSLPHAMAVSLPRQAIHCAIDRVVGCEADGSWSVAAIEWFQKFCANRDFMLKTIFQNDSGSSWLVDLLPVAAGRTVKDMLLAQQLAVQRTNSSVKNNESISKCSQVLPDRSGKEVGDETSPLLPLVLSNVVENASVQADDTVTVTCINSPCNFYVQQQHQDSVEVLQELISHYKTHDQAYHPKQVGELVAVMHNRLWHRAEVLSLDTYSASVFFIDYGNIIDNVDVKNIRALPLHFATVLPKLAVCCAIGGISGTCRDGSYSEAAGKWFCDNYLQATSVVTKVKHTGPSRPLLINLRNLTSTKTARQSLLDYGMALTSTIAASGSAASSLTHSSQMQVESQSDMPSNIHKPYVESTVTISTEHAQFEDAPLLQEYAAVSVVHVISPVDFYVMPSEPAALHEFVLLTQKLAQYCHTSGNAGYCPRYVGEPVAAKFEGEWFRAEVVKLMSNSCSEVFFIDYGNTAVVGVDDLCSLHEEFVKCPKQAVHCGIDGICGTDSQQGFTKVATEWFKKFYCGACATLSSVRIADRKHLVNISVDDDDAKKLLMAAGFARSI